MIKKIKVTIEKNMNEFLIKIYCNNVLKFGVPENNTINAKNIYESLEYESNNTYELNLINNEFENQCPKIYKSFFELFNLYKEIIEEINGIEN